MNRTVQLELPPEFLSLCEGDGVDPQVVLKGFIADLCGLVGYSSATRSDGYRANGFVEHCKAQAYYERCGYPYLKGGPHEGA